MLFFLQWTKILSVHFCVECITCITIIYDFTLAVIFCTAWVPMKVEERITDPSLAKNTNESVGNSLFEFTFGAVVVFSSTSRKFLLKSENITIIYRLHVFWSAHRSVLRININRPVLRSKNLIRYRFSECYNMIFNEIVCVR